VASWYAFRWPKCRKCDEPRYRRALCRDHYYARVRERFNERSPVPTRQCLQCHGKFSSRLSTKKFCSGKCRTASYSAAPVASSTKSCLQCNSEFSVQQPRHKYCSETCQRKAAERRRWPGREKTIKCKRCGEEKVSNRLATFCSRECKQKARHARRYVVKGRPPERRLEATCKHCLKQFVQPARHYRTRVPLFCSPSCGYKHRLRDGAPPCRGNGWSTIAAKIRAQRWEVLRYLRGTSAEESVPSGSHCAV
jgi:hypothetical protein